MTGRGGIVPAAVVDHIAATLAARLPGLPGEEIRAHARAIVADLGRAGWRVTAPAPTTRPREGDHR